MVRWVGERYCAIEIDGVEVVNRLVKHHVWDAENAHTDTLKKRAIETPLEIPKVGDMVIWPMAQTEEHKCMAHLHLKVSNFYQITGLYYRCRPCLETTETNISSEV